MYNCKMCGDATPAGESIIRRVVESREREYSSRQYKQGKQSDPDEGPGPKTIYDPGGVGVETVKEVAVCSDCAYGLDTGVPFQLFKAKPWAFQPGSRAKAKPAPSPEVLTTTRLEPSLSSIDPQ